MGMSIQVQQRQVEAKVRLFAPQLKVQSAILLTRKKWRLLIKHWKYFVSNICGNAKEIPCVAATHHPTLDTPQASRPARSKAEKEK